MSIDIRGTNTINKGAQLMLEAAAERLTPLYQVSASPMGTDYSVRARLGLHQTLHDFRSPRVISKLANATPGFLKKRYGLVADGDITGIVDASGFAYSDAFATDRVRREAIYGIEWEKRGVPKVLLPQALGPFTKKDSMQWYKLLLGQADLVFARDSVSAEYVRSLDVVKRVEVCPDFTMGLPAATIERIVEAPYAAIVPNAKMITSGVVGESAYMRNLTEYVLAARSEGLVPVLVAHEHGDHKISQTLAKELDVEIFAHAEPRVLKAVIGGAELVIGSRFHAMVGSLSQGVRTLTLGWSHKYEQLHADFGVPEWLATTDDDPRSRVAELLADTTGIDRVRSRKVDLLAQVEHMWAETLNVLGSGQRA
jgi:polysaccharide pyruvyl transferase WcaK-like protein